MIAATLFRAIAGMVMAGVLVLGGIAFANVSGFNVFQLGATDRSHPVLLQSIQDVSQYHAAVGNFDVVVDFEDPASKIEAGLPGIIAGQVPGFIAGRYLSGRALSTPTSIFPVSSRMTGPSQMMARP